MMTGMLDLHSILRWVVLILMIWAIAKGFSGWSGNKKFNKGDNIPFLFAMIALHIQLIVGLGLYFSGPWKGVVESASLAPEMLNKYERFWKMEHIGMMVIAIILVTIGHSKVKNGKTDQAKYRNGALFFIIALAMIFMAIPWPFLGDPIGRPLFPTH